MAPQEGIMDPMLMQAMMQGAGSMAPQEGMMDPMVTGMRNGGMAYAPPFGYDDGGNALESEPGFLENVFLPAVETVSPVGDFTAAKKALFEKGSVGRLRGRKLENAFREMREKEKALWNQEEEPRVLERQGVSPTEYPNAIDTVKSLVQGFAAQGVPNPVREGINAAIGFYGIPVDVVNYALGRLGIPTSDSPIGGAKHLRKTFGFETFNESPQFRL